MSKPSSKIINESLKKLGITLEQKSPISSTLFEKFISELDFLFLQNENELARAKHQIERLSVVVKNGPYTISWINKNLEYQEINDMLESLNSNEDLIGKKVGSISQEEKNDFLLFAQDLFKSSDQTLSRELKANLKNEIKHYWAIGTKYSNGEEAVIIGIDITTLKSLQQELQQSRKLIQTDDLTGLYNMRKVYERIEHELLDSRFSGEKVGLVMMDIDHFKKVNDGHNHLFGSFVLAEVGRLIREEIRHMDFAARYGGDEFLFVLTRTDRMPLEKFCERISQKLSNHIFQQGEDQIKLTVSLGYSLSRNASKVSAKALVFAADKALYKSKTEGRNRIFGHLEEHNPELFVYPSK